MLFRIGSVVAPFGICAWWTRTSMTTFCKDVTQEKRIDAEHNTKFPVRFTPNIRNSSLWHPVPTLYFAGSGIIYLHTVTGESKLCDAALYLSNSTVGHANQWRNRERHLGKHASITGYLLWKENHLLPYDVYNPVKLCVKLKLDTTIDTTEICNVLNHSMDCSIEAFQHFSKAFRSSVGDKQFSGDEIAIYWHDNNDVTIAKNGGNHVKISHPEVSYELLDSFCNSRKSVSVDLAKAFEGNIVYIRSEL